MSDEVRVRSRRRNQTSVNSPRDIHIRFVIALGDPNEVIPGQVIAPSTYGGPQSGRRRCRASLDLGQLRLGHLRRELELDTRRRRITTAITPALCAAHGIGPDTATGLLLAAGDNPDRLRSERSWSALLATNPIEASSGKVKRHRLNRGGDRQGNSAVWRIVIVRMNSDPQIEGIRPTAPREGLSKTEIVRCLKRYVARQTFDLLPRELLE